MKGLCKQVSLVFFLGFVATGIASASAVSLNGDPFSNTNFGFTTPGLGSTMICLSASLCSSDNISSNYTYQAGNPTFAVDPNFGLVSEYANMNATFSGKLYDGSGNLLGPYSASGTVGFEFVGRTGIAESGTYEAIMTSDDFSASAYGHTFGLTLNTGVATTGQLDVTPVQSFDGFIYLISLDFNQVHALFTVDPGNGGYSNAPNTFSLSEADTSASVPEPATLTLLGLPVFAMLRRRRKIS